MTDEQETNQKFFKVDERRAINPVQEYFSNGPIISNSQPLLNAANSVSFQPSQSSQSVAVDPALVAANFMPLPQQKGNIYSIQDMFNLPRGSKFTRRILPKKRNLIHGICIRESKFPGRLFNFLMFFTYR